MVVLGRWLSGKESACQVGDTGSLPGLGRSPGEGNGNPLQHSSLGNLMGREVCQAIVSVVSKSWTLLSNKTATRMLIQVMFTLYLLRYCVQ